MKIYHNPRCSKSRKTLNLIKEKTSKFEIIEYTKRPLKFKEIQSLLKKLNMTPIELIRKSEKIWKNNYQNKQTNRKAAYKKHYLGSGNSSSVFPYNQ